MSDIRQQHEAEAAGLSLRLTRLDRSAKQIDIQRDPIRLRLDEIEVILATLDAAQKQPLPDGNTNAGAEPRA